MCELLEIIAPLFSLFSLLIMEECTRDILLTIFEYLEKKEIEACAKVSKGMREVARDPIFHWEQRGKLISYGKHYMETGL